MRSLRARSPVTRRTSSIAKRMLESVLVASLFFLSINAYPIDMTYGAPYDAPTIMFNGNLPSEVTTRKIDFYYDSKHADNGFVVAVITPSVNGFDPNLHRPPSGTVSLNCLNSGMYKLDVTLHVNNGVALISHTFTVNTTETCVSSPIPEELNPLPKITMPAEFCTERDSQAQVQREGIEQAVSSKNYEAAYTLALSSADFLTNKVERQCKDGVTLARMWYLTAAITMLSAKTGRCEVSKAWLNNLTTNYSKVVAAVPFAKSSVDEDLNLAESIYKLNCGGSP